MAWLAGFLGLAMTAQAIMLAIAWSRRRYALEELRRGFVALVEGRVPKQLTARAWGLSQGQVDEFNRIGPQLRERLDRLESERQQLQAVLGSMAEGVLAVDNRLRLVFANPAAQTLFGIGPGQVGRLVPELIRNPKIHSAIDLTLSGAQASHRSEVVLSSHELIRPTQDRYLSIHGTPLPGKPSPGAVLVFHDVTDLRRLERMRQDFVANASHELKTPLASIKVNAETLIDWALHDDAVNVGLIQQIDEQVDRLDHLIRDMLRLARLESGQDSFRHQPLAIAEFLSDCAEAHRLRAETRGLRLTIDLAGISDDIEVRADEEAIRQIVDNLIDNAIKYTSGEGVVRVAGRVEADQILLTVSDTGLGIPREDLPRIFERFYRVDKARSRDMGGTGLGLAIVKHLVLSLGGRVAVSSRLGQGSTFTVRLPRYLRDTSGAVPLRHSEVVPSSTGETA